MKPREEDLRIWAVIAATVRPLPGRAVPRPAGKLPMPPPAAAQRFAPVDPPRRPGQGAPQGIEPGRFRRLALGREAIGGRIDLHGLGQDQARAALAAFVIGAAERGHRGVLVITGKGTLGDGVLRRRVPEWLAEPPLRPLIAGLSEAHRRHGGGGALYVALKRRG
ncbi:MAG TPA: Smr/MutS family protein [Caulobacteraceae bacterium]|jgi:DNA-nicking Smr family endonuclease|nr:Smr/MutS family protein [Caulobacteraceae bacterium]